MNKNYSIIDPVANNQLDDYFYFRWLLLRKEWGYERGSELDELEQVSFHRAAIDCVGEIIGVGRIHFLGSLGQVRYMATKSCCREQGVGSKILNELESIAYSHDIGKIFLNSRSEAVNFYKKNGYISINKAEYSFGSILHYRMEKSLKN